MEQGSVVSPDYDPLLAKLMVVGNDRVGAIALLTRALDEFEVGGLQTTLPFHRWLVEQPDFAAATGLATDLVARSWRPAELVSKACLRAAELAALVAAAPAEALAAPAATDDGPSGTWWRAGIVEATENRP